jgi:Skp family chaperone for outer membrane proteins
MKNNWILGALVVVLSFAFAKAQRGIRVGYIDMEYILDNVPEYQTANSQLEQKMQKWKQEIDGMKTEIDGMKTKLQNERVLLTKELIEEKEEDIKIKEDELNAYQQKRFSASTGDFILQQQQLIQPIQDQVFNAVQKISELRKYDYVMNADEVTILYGAERHDISDLVLKEIGRTAKKGERSKKQKEDDEKEMSAPYLSVEEAENKETKEAAREAILDDREAARNAKAKTRDSLRAAKKAAYEQRRREIKERKDSIIAAREAQRKKKD